MDDDGSGTLSLGEFKKGIKELGLEFTDGEIRRLFDHFDKQRTGSIDFEEFLQSLRNPLNERRIAMVKIAFNSLDADGSGVLDPAELMEKYDASQHPDVLAGKKTETQALREWMTVFEVGGEEDGKVTFNEFQSYYHNLSAVLTVTTTSSSRSQCGTSVVVRVLLLILPTGGATKKDGSQEVTEVKNDLGIGYNDKAKLSAAVKKQDAHASTINLFEASMILCGVPTSTGQRASPEGDMCSRK